MEREEELSVICIKVVVKGKGRDQSTERDSVHDEEGREQSLEEHHKRKYEKRRGCYHI